MLLLVNDNIEDFNLEAAMPFLSQQRMEKIAHLSNVDDRRASAAAYMLLCEALNEEYGITDAPVFEYGDYGKPLLQGYDGVHFSMSHCANAVVCAVAGFPLGVDVESMRPYNARLAQYTMNDAELSRIESSDAPDVEFIRLWTMKEAVAKLSGRGINNLKNLLTEFNGCIKCVEELEKGYVYSVAFQ
jgi:4'-phosphopantetheinyl transferase